MITTAEARHLLAEVDMIDGLPYEVVHQEIGVSIRAGECMQRRLAFFFEEMHRRGLHQVGGCHCIYTYGEQKHGLSRRRVNEILWAGRRLREVPQVDRAFCAHELPWKKTLFVLRVASPEHGDAWVEHAKTRTRKELELDVKNSKPGDPPRRLQDRKGVPEVRFSCSFRLGADAHAKQRKALQKLTAELGRPATVQDLHEHTTELYLQLQSTGEVKGYEYVPSSVYRVHLYPLTPGGPGGGPLYVETDAGLVPLDGVDADGYEAKHRSACACCDGEHIDDEHVDDDHPPKDVPTPAHMRRLAIARDGGKCRCCGSSLFLHVHHIVFRANGGRTKMWNLLAVCRRCHALIHEGLIVIEGTTQKKARFLDRAGHPIHRAGAPPDPGHLLKIAAPPPRPLEERLGVAGADRTDRADGAPDVSASPPEAVDAAWWRQHADRIHCRADQTLAYRPEEPLRDPAPPTEEKRVEDETAFSDLVGRDDVVERLETEARGAKALGTSFPHMLLTGPAGTGKTTIAEATAKRIGAREVRKNGPTLGDVATLLRLLVSLSDGDVLFLDEIHAVSRSVLEVLYEAMDAGRISLTFREGATEKKVVVALARFTLIGATTHPSRLPQPLRSRMELQEHLTLLEPRDLARQASAAARQRGFTLEDDAALLLATRARGIPREVLHLTGRAIARAAAQDDVIVDLPLAEATLAAQGFDADGLTSLEQRYLAELRTYRGAISIQRLADLLQVETATLRREVEPELFRRGLVRISPGGRVATGPRAAPRALPPGTQTPRKQGSAPGRHGAPTPRTPSVHEGDPVGEDAAR